MLKIEKITIYNFKSYYKEQSIDFLDSNGLTIIYGENGAGKSTIMESVKFCLGYHIKKEQINTDVIEQEVLNTLSKQEKDYKINVKLNLKWNDESYEISRTLQKQDNIWENELTIKNISNNNSFLSEDQSKKFIEKIFPEKTIKFFLFDGENTFEEYKSLLSTKITQQNVLKTDILKILGIDSIQNGIHHLKKILEIYTKEKQALSKKSKQNEEIKREIEQLENSKNNLNKQINNKQIDLENYKKEKEELKEYLKNNEVINDYLKKMDAFEKNINEYSKEQEKEISNLQEYLNSNNIFAFCKTKIINLIKEKNEIENNDFANYKQKSKIINEIAELNSLKNANECVHCKREITDEDKRNFDEKINNLKTGQNLNFENNAKYHCFKLIEDIENNINNNYFVKDLKNIEEKIKQLKSKIQIENKRKNNEQQEIEKYKFSNEDTNEYKNKLNKYNFIEDNILTLETDINLHKAQIEEKEKELEDATKKLETDDANKEKEEKISTKIDLVNKLKVCLENAEKKYAVKIKERVKDDANEMFQKIKNFDSYKELLISDIYKVSLKDKNDKIVFSPSQGENVIIILSLIYGIHKNSIVNGTIFFDAPFSVLTDNNSIKIYKHISQISDKVILLSHEKEYLKNKDFKVLNEYEIVKEKSNSNTDLDIYKSKIKSL
ncbi:AAA family ATPase [Metamycoplasma equirhinis]|uniref:AAA family ATPase n=1 Tax=Metamycoplasma equirhinis TaxID=92402 RepID=UPI00359431F0